MATRDRDLQSYTCLWLVLLGLLSTVITSWILKQLLICRIKILNQRRRRTTSISSSGMTAAGIATFGLSNSPGINSTTSIGNSRGGRSRLLASLLCSMSTWISNTICNSNWINMDHVQFTTGLTVLVVILIVLETMIDTSLNVCWLYYSVHKHEKWDILLKEGHHCDALLKISSLMVISCWLGMIAVQMERLLLTFQAMSLSGSNTSNSSRSSNRYRSTFYTVIISMIITATVHQFLLSRLLTLLFDMFFLICYFSLNLSLLYLFVTRTIQVARQAGRTGALFDLAIRISICVIISILASFSTAILYIAHSMVSDNNQSRHMHNNLWFVMRKTVLVVDLSLSAFCMLSSLASADRYYRFVFGSLHDSVKGWLNHNNHHSHSS